LNLLKTEKKLTDLLSISYSIIDRRTTHNLRDHGVQVADEIIPVQFHKQKYADVDKGQISQVIQNIVLNATHAMPEGGMIRISGENHITAGSTFLPDAGGRYVRIAIEDSGIGMPVNAVEKIFDPYFQQNKKEADSVLPSRNPLFKSIMVILPQNHLPVPVVLSRFISLPPRSVAHKAGGR
jgi:signal transduction histidine kinase